MRRRVMCILAVAALLVSGVTRNASAALIFNFLTSTGNANADAGFQLAANDLQNTFSDDVTVYITRGFANLGVGGPLGQAASTMGLYRFSDWKVRMGADARSADDGTMVGGLPASPVSYSKWINHTSNSPHGANSATPYLHGEIQTVRLTSANAKALLLIGAQGEAQDATITFSDQYTWDYDPSDGITAGHFDFVGIAKHELIHAMGFGSGVDVLDLFNPLPNPPGSLFPDSWFDPHATGLDFTRHSADSIAAGADMDWTADARPKDFSINGGGATVIANAWSLGSNFGDGRQASHWKDNLGIGIMDPTSAPMGSPNLFTPNDRQALDVIGWDVWNVTAIPEPGSIAIWSIVLTCVVVWRRRRCPGCE